MFERQIYDGREPTIEEQRRELEEGIDAAAVEISSSLWFQWRRRRQAEKFGGQCCEALALLDRDCSIV